MAASKINRRTRYTIGVIKDTFLSLIKQKPYSKISIAELCRQADINRSTFYLHYNSITDVLNDLLDDALNLHPGGIFANQDLAGPSNYLTQNESMIPACQRIGDSAKYQTLLMDPELSEYIIGRIKQASHDYVVPAIMAKTKLPQAVAESLFDYIVHGSFAVNRAHHFVKDQRWQRDMMALNFFTDAGYQRIKDAQETDHHQF